VDVVVIVGEQNYEPATVQLYHDRVGVKMNFAQALLSYAALGNDTSAYLELSGVAQLQLIKNASRDFSLQYSALEDLRYRYLPNRERPDEVLSYQMSRSEPMSELRFDGNTKTLSARLNYGALHYDVPVTSIASMLQKRPPTLSEAEGDYTGSVQLDIPGYGGTFSYTAASDVFHFKHLHFGDKSSTLKYQGNLLASLDLNPQQGRSLDVDVTTQTQADGSKGALLTLDPTFDVTTKVNFQPLSSQLGPIKDVLVNDTLRVWFEGVKPSFSTGNGKMRIVSGALHMSSQAHPEANVDASAGMCVAEVNSEDGLGQAPIATPAASAAPAPTPAPIESVFDVQVVACQ
jgi:hypothetical protein